MTPTNPGRTPAEPEDRRDLGGDPACWAHLFDDADDADESDGPEVPPPADAARPSS